jgi:spore photoproduct lyase
LKRDLFEQKEIQTVSKHNIFENYLEPWAKIISNQKWVTDAYYVDAFAGTGKYLKTGEAGSPVIASNILLKCQKPSCQFHCICIEKDPKRYEMLESSLKEFEGKLDIEKHNGEFLDFVDTIFDKINKHPAFFFIDPEGFSGMDFDKIATILDLPYKEILINFQYNAIQRWLKAPKVENTISKLFGTPDYNKAKKEIDLIELYKKQLIQRGTFVWYFRNKFPRKNRTFYYLVYATRNLTGFKIMKDIMFGEQSKRYFEPSLFEKIDFQAFQTQVFNRYRGKKLLEYNEILAFVLQETNYLARDLDKALKNMGVVKLDNPRQKYNPLLNFPENFLDVELVRESTIHKYKAVFSGNAVAVKKPKIIYKEYKCIDGKKRVLVSHVNDGSIITRFDKTPLPENTTDVVCPHFLELKWAYGCPYDCSWCYLKGTLRFRPNGKEPVIKDLDKIMLHTRTFLDDVETPEILNTGELADSLMSENTHNPFSKLIIPLFEAQNKHKVLFLTKSSNVENLLEIEPHNQVIISFSLNAIPVAGKWEKAPKIIKRLEAAQKLHDVGYEIRVRIDPMVPIENWEKHYVHLVDLIFERFAPERITLGSLRGLQSTINGCTDKSWVKYLSESSNWGRKIDLATRQRMYLSVIEHLNSQYQYKNVALCKEAIQMWDIIDKDYKKIKCNCVW